MFQWLKKTSNKVNDTLDKTSKDLSETSEKVQKVLDESSDSVKIVVDILVVSLSVSIITNCITMFSTLSKHKYRKMPSITIQNLYLGNKK